MKACPQCHIRYPTDAVHCLLDGAELAAILDPLIGKTIAGCYVIEDMLGEGGMSTVYRARHKLVDRPCAIKVMNPVLATDANVRERFRREARSTQAIAHPNVIEIFDQGEMEDGVPYIVMDLLDGATLSTLVDVGPDRAGAGLPIMIQIARGIARAHDLGVVHRDLKPDNIFICRRGDRGDLVKILDFGIARSRADTRLTNAGELFGTPQYMAPERITSGEAGPSVDLYALGVIFFEMATGRLPFDAPDPATFLIRHMKDVPPAPRTVDAARPGARSTRSSCSSSRRTRARDRSTRTASSTTSSTSRARCARRCPPSRRRTRRARGPRLARCRPPRSTGGRSGSRCSSRWRSAPMAAACPRPRRRALDELKRLVREFGAGTRGEREGAARARGHRRAGPRRPAEARLRGGRARPRRLEGEGRAAGGARRSRGPGGGRAAGREGLRRDAARARDLGGRSAQREPYKQLAEAYRTCAEAVDVWLVERKRERDAQAALESKERSVSDLEYQIAELRAALAKHEQGIDRDRDAAQRRAVELSARQELLEPRVLQLATTFCAPLRARSDLGPLFQRLEMSLGST